MLRRFVSTSALILALHWLAPLQAQIPTDALDMAIASDDHVYVWYHDGTVSSGTSRRLDAYRTPYSYSLPPGKHPGNIVGIGITGSNDHVYAWYDDGTVSSGTSYDLDAYRQPYSYSLPPGKTPDAIVAIAIAGSNDHVYAWYKDGTVSSGTSDDLDRYAAPYPYTLAPGRSPSDVLGIGIAGSNDHVYVWYKDGTASSGVSYDLDRYRAPYPYQQHLFIQSWWGPGLTIPIPPPFLSLDDRDQDDLMRSGDGKRLEGSPGAHTGAEEGISDARGAAFLIGQSPPPVSQPFTPGIEGVDPMVAVGRKFVIVSQQGKIGFFDRNGQQLETKNGVKTRVSGNEFFGSFIDPAAVTDINRYTGFPVPCDDTSYPQTRTGRRFCVGEVYDMRVLFDAATDRFIVYANMRNALWTEAFRQTLTPGDKCGSYDPSSANDDSVDINWTANPGNWCLLARRHVAVGVSVSEDPRDGFFLYATTENNYRDFPWATLNGDSLVVANRGCEMPDGPVATVLSLSALRKGHQRPPYFRYYKEDVNGRCRVSLPVHHGSPGGLTLMVASDHGVSADHVTLVGFPPPAAPYAKPQLTSTRLDINPIFQSVYRNGYLYFTASQDTKLSPNATPRYNIRVVRVPISTVWSGGSPVLNTYKSPSLGYLDKSFGKDGPGDAPGDIVSYEEPALAVNKHGDILVAYGRFPVATQSPLPPEVRYTVWYHNEPEQRRSNILRKGDVVMTESPGARMDYATAVVDPVDEETIWIAHEYGAMGGYKTVVGKVRP